MEDAQSTDLLYGMPAIARFLKIKTRAAYHLRDTAGLPTFKIGGKICARSGSLASWLAERENAAVQIGPASE